jgi:L-asparagine transporter-like permease
MLGQETPPDESPTRITDDGFGDLEPIAWKWLVRLIWIGSTATFETLEVLRYQSGQTYRPFFALFAAGILASVIWFMTWAFRDTRQRRQARAELAASGQLRSPLYIAANLLVVFLIGLILFIGHMHRDHAAISSSLWIVVALIIAALLLLRRALKSRYPHV